LAFVGAGSLGQAFAGLLAANGQAVALLASPRSAERLQSAGKIRLRGVVTADVPVTTGPAAPGRVAITSNPTDVPPAVGLFFATKGHQLPAAIAAVRAAWPRPDDRLAWVAGLQNGLVKDDLLASAFGPERVVGAATILGAARQDDGTVTVASRGATYLGEFSGPPSPRVTSAVEVLRTAGVPTEAVADVRSVLWSKALNAVGVFGVCVLARCSSTAMGRSPDLVRAYLSLIDEAAAVANANGVALGDYAGFPIRTYVETPEDEILARFAANAAAAPPGPESFPSMVQDLLAGRPLESEAIFADMVDRGARVGAPVPRIQFVRDVVRGIEAGRTLLRTA
jgi:2-dehydropantoate 2-reductase